MYRLSLRQVDSQGKPGGGGGLVVVGERQGKKSRKRKKKGRKGGLSGTFIFWSKSVPFSFQQNCSADILPGGQALSLDKARPCLTVCPATVCILPLQQLTEVHYTAHYVARYVVYYMVHYALHNVVQYNKTIYSTSITSTARKRTIFYVAGLHYAHLFIYFCITR